MYTTSFYNENDRIQLLSVASDAITRGMRPGIPFPPRPGQYSAVLEERRASFVTLKIDAHLRGCIGTLQASRPLIEDVGANAFAAAYRDPRFPPVAEEELVALRISIAVLSAPEPLTCDSEQELIVQLRPGIDGLVFEEGDRRGTFLPAVWENLPEPRDFVRQLKQKAGLPPDYWSQELKIYRYHTDVISEV
jgi:AmmeMemoRadiSam system protein A